MWKAGWGKYCEGNTLRNYGARHLERGLHCKPPFVIILGISSIIGDYHVILLTPTP